MNSNSNVKKRVGSSIFTILIIAFGLFLVCGVRPPQPQIEDSAVDGTELENTGMDELGDDDLAEFLDEEDSDNTGSDSGEELFTDDSEGFSDDSEDGEMSDILKLLDSDDSDSEEDDDLFAFEDNSIDENDQSDIEFASVNDLTSSASSSEEADQFEGALSDEAYSELTNEAERLTESLGDKDQEADSLKQILESYDEKIAVMELENSGVGQQYSAPSTFETSPTTYSSNESSTSEYASSESSYSTPAPQTSSASTSSRPKKRAKSKAEVFSSKYNSALNKYNSGSYDSAARKFEELISKESTDVLADDCQFWLGECHLAMRDYTRAILEYEKVFAFDDNENADDAQFKIGLSFLESGNRKMAKNELDSLLDFYADSQLARKARSYLQRL